MTSENVKALESAIKTKLKEMDEMYFKIRALEKGEINAIDSEKNI